MGGKCAPGGGTATSRGAGLAHTAVLGVALNERVGATLEIESGMNDPMAVYLTLAFIGLITAAEKGDSGWVGMGLALAQQFGWGALIGAASGFAMAALVQRTPVEGAGGGIFGLLLGSAGLGVFALAGLVGGSGFLAVYLFGLVVGNRTRPKVEAALVAMDGYAWLAQAGMFLLLGLLVTPSDMVMTAGPALGVAAVLMFVARPAAVWLCLAPHRFRPNEVWFIAWVGPRGAVPIVLAIFPLMAGVPQAMLLFNVAFVAVLAGARRGDLQRSRHGRAAHQRGGPQAGRRGLRTHATFLIIDAPQGSRAHVNHSWTHGRFRRSCRSRAPARAALGRAGAGRPGGARAAAWRRAGGGGGGTLAECAAGPAAGPQDRRARSA